MEGNAASQKNGQRTFRFNLNGKRRGGKEGKTSWKNVTNVGRGKLREECSELALLRVKLAGK